MHTFNGMTDKEIDYSDIPPLRDDFFKEAHVRWPEKKQQVTLRIDPYLAFYGEDNQGED